MFLRRNLYFSVVAVSIFLAAGCASVKVERVEREKKVDLSGTFNDYDAFLVSQEMIKDCLERPWRENFIMAKGKNPVVIVGNIVNRSHEHITEEIFTKALEKELLNSGKVDFVADVKERMQIRDERQNQQEGYTSPETIKKFGREIGADYMLIGSIDSVKDELKNKYAVLYQINLELIDLESNKKVWIGQKPIKKVVTKSKASL